MEKFWDLKVFQKGHELVKLVYLMTESFPKDEKFGLVSQMRRSAVSVVANIVESTKRKTVNDRKHFFVMADASLEELKYYFYLASELNYVKVESSRSAIMNSREVGKMLNGLSKSLDK